MPAEATTADPEVLDETPVDDEPQDAADDAANDDPAEGEAAAAEVEAEEELVVTLGEDPPADAFEDEDGTSVKGLTPEQLSAFVRLRQQRAAAKRELKRLQELASTPAAQSTAAPLGEMPKIDDPGIDYDHDKHAEAVAAWAERKAADDIRKRQQQEAERTVQAKWQARQTAVNTAESSLKLADREEAKAAFEDAFTPMQQAMILDLPDDPKTSALLRYALGKAPKLAAKLAAIDNPAKFIWELRPMVDKLKTESRKSAPPPPDSSPRNTGGGTSLVADSRLKALHEKAQRTGDFTDYLAAKRQRKAA